MKRHEELEVSEETTMTSLFDDLCTGLDQAIEFAKGTGEARVTHCIIEPVKRRAGILKGIPTIPASFDDSLDDFSLDKHIVEYPASRV